ncbi:hypothetical protein FRC03_011202 [Tulasnella sp. 419]|nr:hypothetical protein FRC02_010488 [Tulasnella sp. 418]KAG8955499.1 hypothetical protein FRC03_011202 [Tulasnella sp. 419]
MAQPLKDEEWSPAVNPAVEDRETIQSEKSGTIPRREVEDLGGSANIISEKGSGIKTRGVKNDAMKQERDIDEAVAYSDRVEESINQSR